MYPSLDVSTPAASLAATSGPAAGGGAGAAAAAGGGSFGDGSSGSGDGPLFPLLRVQVNSKLRVAPQVLIPTADPSSSAADAADNTVPRFNFAFDFDAERKAVERAATEAEKDGSDGAAAPSSSSSGCWTPPDPWSALFERLLREGAASAAAASREEVALAAAAAAALANAEAAAGEISTGSGEESSLDLEGLEKKTLEPLRQLTQMGFDPPRALGALVVSRGDLAAATDACLAAAAASGARI